MFQMKVVEKFKTHILCMHKKKKESENLAFCEKTCKNMVQREKPQITI